MIDSRRPGRSPLLRKPLTVTAGGAGHVGTDRYGRDVYRTTNDPGYLVLARWVFSVAPVAPPMMMPTMPPAAGVGGVGVPPPAGAGAPPAAGTGLPPAPMP